MRLCQPRRKLVRRHDRRRQVGADIMGGISEFERKPIQSRCEAGIAKARANGKKFGRPSALDVGQRRKIAERYAAARPWRNWPASTNAAMPRSGARAILFGPKTKRPRKPCR